MTNPPARWKDLCVDAVDDETAARFWSAALGLEIERRADDVRLTGPTPEHTVWLNAVPEAHTAKNRVHLDVNTGPLEELLRIGATQVADLPHWTVLADPDGQEFCAFVRDIVPEQRLYEIVVDAADARAQAAWWANVFGVAAQTHDDVDWWWVEPPGAPFGSIVFVAVPEPKTVKNRVHWDVTGDVDALLAAGATVLRRRDDEIRWDVLADPEGNEFCVFAAAD